MIKQIKKTFISSILAALVIFGAVMPMASATLLPSAPYADGYDNHIYVFGIDPTATTVTLYNAAGSSIRTATNSVPSTAPTSSNPSVITAIELSNVTFDKMPAGDYFVSQTIAGVESSKTYVKVLLTAMDHSVQWGLTGGKVTISNVSPGANVKLIKRSDSSVVSSVYGDSNGIAVFNAVPADQYSAVETDYLHSYLNPIVGTYGDHSGVSSLPTTMINCFNVNINIGSTELNVITDAQGTGTVNVTNAIPSSLIKLYLSELSQTTSNTTVTGAVYLSTTADSTGLASFPAAATKPGNYEVVEINNGAGSRATDFNVIAKAPVFNLAADGIGFTISGALPHAKIKIFDKNSNNYIWSGYADASGNIAEKDMLYCNNVLLMPYSGKFYATQTPNLDEDYNSTFTSSPSTTVSVQKSLIRYIQPGWNTLSVPFALQTPTLQVILGSKFSSLILAEAYDSTNKAWVALTDANQSIYLSKPMTALYINISGSEDVPALFLASSAPNPPINYSLTLGWNLVGPSSINNSYSTSDFLYSNVNTAIPMLLNPNGLGAAIVNPTNGSCNSVINGYGYWVYTTGAASIISQISTGLINSGDSNNGNWTMRYM